MLVSPWWKMTLASRYSILGLAPHVEVPLDRSGWGATRGLEPLVLIGGVVDHEFGDDLYPALVSRSHEAPAVLERAVARVHAAMIRDVVSAILERRFIERQKPDTRHAEALEVAELLGETLEVADAVAITVVERAHLQRVDDRVLVPVAHDAP